MDTDFSVRAAGGYLIQLMPDASDEEAGRLEERISDIKPVSALVDEGVCPERILEYVLQDQNLKLLERKPIKLKCDCSRRRPEEVLLSLGKDDIRDMLEKDGKAELVCHFCCERYVFGADELQRLLDI